MWQDVKLPDGKVLIPGVIDSLTNFVEHPELVAQRIVHYANLVGRENVIAGTDCGSVPPLAVSNTVDTAHRVGEAGYAGRRGAHRVESAVEVTRSSSL